ncbi:hypothetical protein KAI87_16435, partial [Myxococcota bacterium]|nr:hypothetical protein [Myxococcota bacterium]
VIDPAVVLGLDEQPPWVGQAVLLRSSEGSQDRLGIQVRRVREMVNEEALEEVDVPHGPCVAWTAKVGRNLIHVIDRKQLMDGVKTYFETPL